MTLRFSPIVLTALLTGAALSSATRADVYVGTAFNIRELVQRPAEWADVRGAATGYYFHPRSGNEASELKGLEQRQVTSLFAHPRVITERNNGGADDGDRQQYELMRDCGMTPVAGLVAEVNRLGPWAVRVGRSSYTDTAGKSVAVPLVADQRPWTSAWNKTVGWSLERIEAEAESDAELKTRLAIMTTGAGFALETDNSRSSVNGKTDPASKHFRICQQMLSFAKAKGKMTMLFLHGFETADPQHYVEANLDFLRALEDAGLYPDVLICSFYTPESPVKLLPETATRDGRRVPQDTLTGLAWAALAREGAVPLRDGESLHIAATTEKPVSLPATVPLDGNRAQLTLRLDNPNPAVDFAPALVFEGANGIRITAAFEGEQPKPVEHDVVRFTGLHRMTPGAHRTVRLTFERAATTAGHASVRVALRQHAFAAGSPTTLVATVAAP